MSTVISIRVSREIKRILEEAGIDVSEEIKKYLEFLAVKVKARRFVDKWDRILDEKSIPNQNGFAYRSVREDRESH